MPLTGDFARLQSTIRGLRALASVPARAAAAASVEIKSEIEKSFSSNTDPYGKPWPAHAPATVRRWGRHPLLRLTGAGLASIDVRPQRGSGIAISVDSDGLMYAQSGTSNEPRRRWLPDDRMPRTWRLALERAVTAQVRGAIRGVA